MNPFRYITDDRDFPLDEQRELFLFKDDQGHFNIDVVAVGNPSLKPVVVSKTNPQHHEIYVMLDSIYLSMNASDQGVAFEGYHELKEELQAWQNEFGSAGRTLFPEFMPTTHAHFASIVSDHNSDEGLQILLGGNQDWYISRVSLGNKELRGVRLCTSGGANSHVPDLVAGVAEIYRILLSEPDLEKQSPSYGMLFQEVNAFRGSHPGFCYRFGFIQEKELDF